jgi:acyl carrier protein
MELQSFIAAFADQFEDTDPNEISATTNFKDLDEWDSLTSMLLIGLVKTEYGKNITNSEIVSCETVEDLFHFISTK